MTDAELIEWLRKPYGDAVMERAADRIEQLVATNEALTAERDEAINQLDSARYSVDVLEKRVAFVEKERKKTFQALLKTTKIHDEAEAKLAKAVELALEECPFRHGTPKYNDWWHHRRATLAEIKGGNDAESNL